MDSALCALCVTRVWRQRNASRSPRRAVSHTLLELYVYLIANG